MNEDWGLIKDGLREVESRMKDEPDSNLKKSVLLLQSAMVLLTEITYHHAEITLHGVSDHK